MAYTIVPATDATRLLQAFNKKWAKRGNAKTQNEIVRYTNECNELARQLAEELSDDMDTVNDNWRQHQTNVNTWMTEALNLQKESVKLAAAYKKDPKGKSEFLPQLERNINRLAALDQQLDTDINDFGHAWFTTRGLGLTDVPNEYTRAFYAQRQKIMEGGKAVLLKHNKLTALRRETKSLLAVTAKAKLKQGIKAETTDERSMQAAGALATALNAKLFRLLAELQQPATLKPNSLRGAADIAENNANDRNSVTDEAGIRSTRSSLSTAVATVKAMETRLAAMTKIYENGKKGFRSAELKDPQVQPILATAAGHLTTAKNDIKVATARLKRIQKAAAKIESNYKAHLRRG